MSHNVRAYSAIMAVPEGYIGSPAHDVVHPGTGATPYSTGFESGVDGWTPSSGASVGVATNMVRSGTQSLGLYRNSSGSPDVSTATRTVTGLTIGSYYTFSAWVRSSSTVTNVYLGVAGIGVSTSISLNSTQPWQQMTYGFFATASSHQLIIGINTAGTWSSTLNPGFRVDDVSVIQTDWTEHFPSVTSYTLPFDILNESGSGSLDENRAPYGEFSLTVAMPDVAAWVNLIDNRTVNRRVTVTLEESWFAAGAPIPGTYTTTSTFDLVLRDRVLDFNSRTIELTLATDEALLMDLQRVATTVDKTALQYQSSARSIVGWALSQIGATLEPGTADADFTTLTSVTNMFTNPSAQVDLTDTTSSNLTSLVRQTGASPWGSRGTAFRLNGGTSSNDSWMNVGGDTGALRLGMQAGKTYTVSGVYHTDSAVGGTSFAGRARSIQVVTISPTGGTVFTGSPAATNAAGVTQRLSVTFTVPKDATTACIRFYHGHNSTSVIYWTDLMLVEGDGKETDTVNALAFFDGDTADTSKYNYDWTGLQGKSTSTRRPVFNRDPQTLSWVPGESLYNFLRPIIDTLGLRLFCDEQRKWRLVDPTYSIIQRVQLAATQPVDNIYVARDTISKTATGPDGLPLHYSGVVVDYSWTDSTNTQQTATDAAGSATPGPVLHLTLDRPYMGPGMAAYILARGVGKGRTLDLTVRRDFSIRPGMEAVVSLPIIDIQTGRVGAVSWDFGSDDMSVTTKGLTDTPANAWALAPNGRTWATVTGTWATYTN